MKNKIYIISNEIFYFNGKNFFCDNIDLKSIPEEFNKFSEVHLLARKSNSPRSKKVNIDNIVTSKNIFTYLIEIFKSLKYKNAQYLIISISPFTFLASLILKIFLKKTFYLFKK